MSLIFWDITDREERESRPATGGESLREYAQNAGMDNPERCWLLDPRDVWVRNPYYNGPDVPHPDDEESRYFDALNAIENAQPPFAVVPPVVYGSDENDWDKVPF